jgi:hypothetical protein
MKPHRTPDREPGAPDGARRRAPCRAGVTASHARRHAIMALVNGQRAIDEPTAAGREPA